MAAKNFMKNPRHFPRCTKLRFFIAATLGASGPKIFRKRGIQKSMGNKAPWKTGMLIYLPVTSRPLISLHRKKQFHHLVTSRPPIWQLAFWISISLQLRDPWNGGPFRNAPNFHEVPLKSVRAAPDLGNFLRWFPFLYRRFHWIKKACIIQKYASDPRPPHTRQKYEQKSGQNMTPNASKQGKFGSLGAIFLFMFGLYVSGNN